MLAVRSGFSPYDLARTPQSVLVELEGVLDEIEEQERDRQRAADLDARFSRGGS